MDSYKCSVCYSFYTQPCSISCTAKHVFCRACIQGCQQAGGASFPCPLCRENIPNGTGAFVPNHQIEREMRRKRVACDNCKGMFPADFMNNHLDTCKSPVKTPRTNSGATRSPASQASANRSTFSCPYCHSPNLTSEALVSHCLLQHNRAPTHQLVCPVCASMPWGDASKQSSNLLDHLKMRHKFEYNEYVDYQEDEDSALQRVIEASRQTY